MILYNSLGQTKQEFVPHTPGKVNMYTCGPTVYHYAHIGNLRTYIMEDVLEKYLRFSGYDVNRGMRMTLLSVFVTALKRTKTSVTRLTLFSGSQSQSLIHRSSSGTVRGA